MNENNALLQNAIRLGTAEASFSKKGSAWYSRRAETILRLSPQKSQYGDLYYLNVGVYFLSFGEKAFPQEVECQLRARIEDFASDWDEAKILASFLDFDVPCMDREAVLSDLIRTRVVPFLESASSLDGLRQQLHTPRLKGMAVMKVLMQQMGVEV
jgi:hypothetical protein